MQKSHRKRPSLQNNSLRFSKLEKRALLAAIIDFDPATQIVTIEGTSQADEVRVNYVNGYGNIRVVVSDGETINRLELSSSQISEIHFNGNEGDDLFRNSTHRTSVVDGGVGNDQLIGGWGADVLFGGGGRDIIAGRFGSDMIDGYSGHDTLRGGSGDDHIEGGSGDDIITGGAGSNTIDAGAGDDIVFGGSGQDVIDGSAGNDLLYAGSGDDIVQGGDGNDLIRGGSGADEIDGGLGNDRVNGDRGNDTLSGSEGIDRIFGGVGDDDLYGGDDNDFLFGGSGADLLVGDDGDDTLYGEGGRDILLGRDGQDALYGGLGETDQVEGGRGADRILSLVDQNDRLEELILGLSNEDAIVRFENLSNHTVDITGIGNVTFTSQAWTDAEVRLIDQALNVLHKHVDGTALLKTSRGVALRFQRVGDLIGQSFEIGGWNENGTIGLSNSAFRTDLRALAVTYHEVGHNWDQRNENPLIADFQAISRWQNSPGSGLTLATGRGAWHYSDGASEFAREYGRWSPFEDYATTWETYFTANYHGSNGWRGTDTIVAEKFANLDAFFEQLS